MKKILATLLAVMMCLAMFAACDDKDTPAETTGTGTGEVTENKPAEPSAAIKFEDFEKDPNAAISKGFENSFAFLSEMSESASLEGVVGVDFALSALDTYEIELSAIADGDKGAFSGNLAAKIQEIELNLGAWYDGKALALSLPEILGDEVYGIDIENLEADFAASELFDGMTLDQFKEQLIAAFNEGFSQSMGMDLETYIEMYNQQQAQLEELYTAFGEDLLEVISKTETKTEAVTWTEGGASVAASKAAYTLTATDIAKLCEVFADFAEGYGAVIPSEDLDTIFEEAKDSDAKAVVEVWMNNATGTVMQVKITLSGGDLEEDIVIDLILGEDIGASTNVILSVDAPGEEDYIFSLTEVTEEGKGGFVFSVVAGGKTVADISFVRNLSDGEYLLEAVADGATVFAVTGTCIEDDISFWLSVDSIKAGDVTVDLECSLSVKTVGTVEAVPEYKNVLELTEAELSALAMKAQTSDIVVALSELIESMQGGAAGGDYTEDELRALLKEYGYTDEEIEQYIQEYFYGVTWEDYTDESLREELLAAGYTDEAMIDAYIDYYFDYRTFTEEELRALLAYFDYTEEEIEEEIEWYFWEEPTEDTLREELRADGYTDEAMIDAYIDYYFGNRTFTEEELRALLAYFDYTEEEIEDAVEWYFWEYVEPTADELREMLKEYGYTEEEIEQYLEEYYSEF